MREPRRQQQLKQEEHVDQRDYRHDFATFVKVAIAAAVVYTIIKTDIQSEMKFTENVRNGFYAVQTDPSKGGGHAGF